MTLHVGPLPAGDERHLKAVEAAAQAWDTGSAADFIAAYHASLADQGVRLVDASEVAEWLRSDGPLVSLRGYARRQATAAAFLARFGGGDER